MNSVEKKFEENFLEKDNYRADHFFFTVATKTEISMENDPSIVFVRTCKK